MNKSILCWCRITLEENFSKFILLKKLGISQNWVSLDSLLSLLTLDSLLSFCRANVKQVASQFGADGVGVVKVNL